MRDYRTARLSSEDRAMLDFAVKLTRRPAAICRDDVEELRRHGFDDDGINDIVQITAMFNYFIRIADGLGIDPEPEWG